MWGAVKVTNNQPGKPHANNEGSNGMKPGSIGPIFQVKISIEIEDHQVQGPANERHKNRSVANCLRVLVVS